MEEIIRLLDLARAKIAKQNISLERIHEICKLIGMAEIKLKGSKNIDKSNITLL